MKEVINSQDAPQPIGPYSQAVKVDNLLFCSGQIPLVAATGQVCAGNIKQQTQLVLENLRAVLSKAGMGFSNVIKTTIFLTDMRDFSDVNAVYNEFFKDWYPARSCIAVKELPKGVQVEIEAIAYKQK